MHLLKRKIDSLYVTSKFAGMLNMWIEQNRDKVEFQLLFRGNRDVLVIKVNNICSSDRVDSCDSIHEDDVNEICSSKTCEQGEYILNRMQHSRYLICDMSCKLNNIGFGHDLW
ncbi:4799_t:CDS:2 [Funneliformis mosseae]|uniref:4799_t:CDS:1 n=1 Tax=Funneliformis mosseae TaxID=27381 RepID=A0A9N9AG82_FUNMO|nr:4799_t:CDS:2 [Funneliformis mosseae]